MFGERDVSKIREVANRMNVHEIERLEIEMPIIAACVQLENSPIFLLAPLIPCSNIQ